MTFLDEAIEYAKTKEYKEKLFKIYEPDDKKYNLSKNELLTEINKIKQYKDDYEFVYNLIKLFIKNKIRCPCVKSSREYSIIRSNLEYDKVNINDFRNYFPGSLISNIKNEIINLSDDILIDRLLCDNTSKRTTFLPIKYMETLFESINEEQSIRSNGKYIVKCNKNTDKGRYDFGKKIDNKLNHKPDAIFKINEKFVFVECKYIIDMGGAQNKQIKECLNFLRENKDNNVLRFITFDGSYLINKYFEKSIKELFTGFENNITSIVLLKNILEGI